VPLLFSSIGLAHNKKVGPQSAILFLMIVMSDVHHQTVCVSITCNLFFGHHGNTSEMHGLKISEALSCASLET